MENKKVKHAEEHVYEDIRFKSKLEVDIYKALSAEGFNPEYEKHTIHLTEGSKSPIPIYDLYNDRKMKKKVWGLNRYMVRGLKYTPDFVFKVGNTTIYVEGKGFANDRYPYQKKLFLKWLEKNNPDSVFFEIHNQKHLKSAIEIIKNINQ